MIEVPRPPTHQDIETFRANGWWKDQTFSEILEQRAHEMPEREALCDARRRVSYGGLWREVKRFAEFLRRQGVQRGDVVTLQLPNRIEFPVVFFSLELIGAVANKISADFRAVEGQFKGFDYLAMIGQLRPRLPDLSLVICVDEVAAPDVVSFATAVHDTPEMAGADRIRMSPLDVMRMCFTSGTTGNPKGVLHCFNTTLCTCETFNSELAVTANDVMLDYLPVGLNWGYMTLVQSVMAGARVVLMERFSAEGALELIEKERVSYIPTAPASIVAMLNSPALPKHDLSSLRIVITGGASAAVETIKAFQAAVPHAKLIELYGMLETGYHAFTRLTDDPLKVNGTVGRCVDAMGLRILDDDGNDVPYGDVGEIAAIGPSVHMGYLDNPTANRDSFTADGWFRTGDLGQYADKDGNVRIAGRKKEIVNRGGKKYFPREIEELLYQHPKIVQAAIVGAPDPRLGEKNCLCAIVKDGASLTLDEVVSFLKGRVADYKLPEALVVMSDFPMTPTGKIRRPELVKRVAGNV